MAQMQLLSRSMHRLLRSSNVPTSMHRLASMISQPLLYSMASGTPSSLARPTHHVSRFPHGSRNLASGTGVKNQDDLGKADTRQLNPSTNDFISPLGKECLAAKIPDDPMDDEGVDTMEAFPYSSHRDGSIYGEKGNSWKGAFCIADRSETRLEAMRFSHPTNCFIRDGICNTHAVSQMLQIFSLRLARIPVEHGSVELYGYIAARDALDSLLNYFINVSRDNPIIVKQGSLINMSGPKRGTVLVDTTLIEYDMKIKTGKHENEDLQLIDGVSAIDIIDAPHCRPITYRIYGDCGAIDLSVACLYAAVEATIEVVPLEMQHSFKMRLSCFTSGIRKEIRLFDGAIDKPRGLNRFVVAVLKDSEIELRLKVAGESCIHCCGFKANKHGHANQEIKTDFALFAVKVTWSTLM